MVSVLRRFVSPQLLFSQAVNKPENSFENPSMVSHAFTITLELFPQHLPPTPAGNSPTHGENLPGRLVNLDKRFISNNVET